jgi:site-specific recombinase XerD
MKAPLLLQRDFLAHMDVEQEASVLTIKSYSIDLTQFFAFLRAQKISLGNVNLKVIRSYLSHMKDLGLKNSSRERKFTVLRSFFRFLVMEKVLKADPTLGIKFKTKARFLPKILTPSEINRLILTAKGSTKDEVRDRAILEFAYGTGARISEIADLTVGDIHFASQTVRLSGKGGKKRTIPLAPQCIRWLERYLEIRKSWKPKSEHFFLNRSGRAFQRHGLWRMMKLYGIKAGLPMKIHPHLIRHCFATHLSQAGCDIRLIQRLMGHSSINSTVRYIHLDTEDLAIALIKYHPRT